MAQYIDKSAVVAELERLISNGQTKLKESEECKDYESYVALAERIATCINVLSFLDTLEVKGVKKEPVSKDLEEAISQSFIYHENHGDDFRSDKQIETAYRCGFETCAKYLTEDIKKQTFKVKEVDLKKEIKDYFDSQPIITRSHGIDYQLIPSAEVIAKHVFELGLKHRKENKL